MKEIRLTIMMHAVLKKHEMQNALGGTTNNCGCACAYANKGGSSTKDNNNANKAGGKSSPGMPKKNPAPHHMYKSQPSTQSSPTDEDAGYGIVGYGWL